MKTLQHCVIIALVGLILAAIIGCDNDSGDRPPPPIGPFRPRIVMEEDTIYLKPNDWAATNGAVIAEDESGNVGSGYHVDLTVAPLGYLEYMNPILRDTTDEMGRVKFTFHTCRDTGITHIKAKLGFYDCQCSLYVAAAD